MRPERKPSPLVGYISREESLAQGDEMLARAAATLEKAERCGNPDDAALLRASASVMREIAASFLNFVSLQPLSHEARVLRMQAEEHFTRERRLRALVAKGVGRTPNEPAEWTAMVADAEHESGRACVLALLDCGADVSGLPHASATEEG